MEDINCPYCDAELSIERNEWTCNENVTHHMECPECEKSFVFDTTIIFIFQAHKADCLNEGSHEWEKTVTCPVEATQMRCRVCDEHRELTQEERTGFGIRSMAEFWEEFKASKK